MMALSLAWPDPAQGGYKISAESAIFSNSTKQKRYFGKNVHRRLPVASTTKVMTALLVLERLPLNTVVKVSRTATLAEPSKIYVKAGERYRVKDLLHALLMKSANDAAVVLAEAVSGSEREFAGLMNARARQLGARRTKFINANGLPGQGGRRGYSTAYDMYLIFRQALKHSYFRRILSTRESTISSLAGRRIRLVSHNKNLSAKKAQRVYGKTGWTRKARKCFVGYIRRGEEISIIGVFGATSRQRDIQHIISRYHRP